MRRRGPRRLLQGLWRKLQDFVALNVDEILLFRLNLEGRFHVLCIWALAAGPVDGESSVTFLLGGLGLRLEVEFDHVFAFLGDGRLFGL